MPEVKPNLSQRLVLTHTAQKDFQNALALADQEIDPLVKAGLYLHLSRRQAQGGFNPLNQPGYFLDIASHVPPWHHSLYEGIAYFQAGLGDIKGSWDTADKSFGFYWIYAKLGRIVHEKGEDPKPFFDKAHQKLDSIDGGFGVRTIAEAQRAAGLDVPKSLVDRFRETSYNKLYLASAYAAAGYPLEALEIWDSVPPADYHHKAEVLSEIAMSEANSGQDPSETAEKVVVLTEALRVDGAYNPSYSQTGIYINLAGAFHKHGLDGKEFIRKALEKASHEPSNLRVNAYINLAKGQRAIGMDPEETLKLALESADEFFKDRSNDYFVDTITYGDVIKAQIEAGLLEAARMTIARFDRYPESDNYNERFHSLTRLARGEAKAGLSLAGIATLSPQEISALLLSEVAGAKEAAEYFELNKIRSN